MIVLENGDKIRGDATTNAEVDFTIHGLDNNALKQLADGQLANSIGDLYTADSTDVVTAITLVNTGAAHNHVNLYLTPSAGTARRLIAKNLQLESGYSLHFDGVKFYVIDTSGKIVGQTGEKGDTGATGPAPAGQIILSAAGGCPRTTGGCANQVIVEAGTNKINYWVMDFDKDTDEFAQWQFAWPSDWDAGTVTAVFYWLCAAGIGGANKTVCWSIRGGCWGNDEAIDTALGTAVAVTDTWLHDAYVHISAATAAITFANATAGDLTIVEVMRDVSEDDLVGDARLIEVRLTFTRT